MAKNSERVSARLPKPLYDAFMETCEKRDIGQSDLVREALANLLKMTDSIVYRDNEIEALTVDNMSLKATISQLNTTLLQSQGTVAWLLSRNWVQRLFNSLPKLEDNHVQADSD